MPNGTKKPERPKKNSGTNKPDLKKIGIFPPNNVRLLSVIEKYIKEAKITKIELMTAIGLGEVQIYRWSRGESVPRKTTLCLLAVEICRRLDLAYGNGCMNTNLFTGKIDLVLGELLESTGYSFISGKIINSSWIEIDNTNIWKIGYSKYFEVNPVGEKNQPPSGLIVNYCNSIANWFGWNIQWFLLTPEQMKPALMMSSIHTIAPCIPFSPDKFIDFNFCNPYFENITYVGITDNSVGESFNLDLSVQNAKVKLIYIAIDIPAWFLSLFEKFNQQIFASFDEAVAFINGEKSRNPESVVVLIVNNITAKSLLSCFQSKLKLLPILGMEIKLQTGFVVHPEESRLVEALNRAIDLQNKIKL
jgi:hypothetical protein